MLSNAHALVPLAFVALIVVLMVLYGLIHLIPFVGDIADSLAFPVLMLLGFGQAVLLIGLVGYPLMYATVSAEGSDTFDALSRSYNYVFQSPWNYIWYSLVAILYGAVLVFFVVRRRSANPVWAALLAAIITMVAFVAAVNAAVYIDGQIGSAAQAMRSLFAGLAGGLVGSGLMALGTALLPAGPRNAASWLPMLVTGTVAGSLLALDTSLGLDRTSVLYPVWQAAVGVRVALALRR